MNLDFTYTSYNEDVIKFKQYITSGIYMIKYRDYREGYAFSYTYIRGKERIFVCFPQDGPGSTYSTMEHEGAVNTCTYITGIPEPFNVLDRFLEEFNEQFGLLKYTPAGINIASPYQPPK